MKRDNKNNPKARVIIRRGINMLTSILGVDSLEIVAGWCKVFHQSTENFIIGIFIKPIIPNAADILEALSLFEIECHNKI